MNAAISSVVKTQVSNSASAVKTESEIAKSTEEVSGGQNTASETSVSSKYDTLEMSREYLEYRTQSENSTLQDETSQLNSTVVRYAGGNSNEEVVYSIQLYSYTETELLEMYNDGTISIEEYDAEIARRNTSFSKE